MTLTALPRSLCAPASRIIGHVPCLRAGLRRRRAVCRVPSLSALAALRANRRCPEPRGAGGCGLGAVRGCAGRGLGWAPVPRAGTPLPRGRKGQKDAERGEPPGQEETRAMAGRPTALRPRAGRPATPQASGSSRRDRHRHRMASGSRFSEAVAASGTQWRVSARADFPAPSESLPLRGPTPPRLPCREDRHMPAHLSGEPPHLRCERRLVAAARRSAV